MRKNIKFFKLLIAVIFLGVVFSVLYNNFGHRLFDFSKESRVSDAYHALKFWTNARAYPKNDISKKNYFEAFQKLTEARKNSSIIQQDDTVWEAMGPHNVPGRMISLAVNPLNPSTLYAGSASGGLWRTFNAQTGSGWHQVSTGFPVLGVMAIAIDPADSNIIYIGTGEVYGYQKSIGGQVIRTTRGSYGLGILKTLDGGSSWEACLDWTDHQERGVQALKINPQNPSSLIAATTEGIYKSTNAGLNWEMVLPVLMGEDILIHPKDTTKVLVSCGNLDSPGSGIYRSLDGGVGWDQLHNVPSFTGKTLFTMYATNPDTVFASVADSLEGIGLYRTYNFGDMWSVVHTEDVPQYQGWFSHWVAVHPQDIMQVVHAGVQIYKSNDGGVSLNFVGGPHVDHHNYAYDPADPDILYIACDGGVYRSTNFGASYQNIGYGLQTAQFYNGFSSSNTDSMLAIGGLQDNGTQLYRGTKDWSWVLGGDGCWTAINQLNDNIIYAESQNNNISKSTNRGELFITATSGMTESGSAAFVAPYVLSASNPSILYSGRRSVFKTTSESGNWFNTTGPLDGNAIISMAIATTDPNIVYAATAPQYIRAHIFRTINGGTEWYDVTGSLPDRYPMDLAIDPNENQTVYAVFAGYGSGHVYKSENSGNDWENITGILPDVPTLAIAIDPLNSDHVYVGNDLGVYASTDGGLNWETFTNGLPEAVIAMDLNVSQPNRRLRIATHGNGAYEKPLIYQPLVYLAFNLGQVLTTVLQYTDLTFTAIATNVGTQTQTEPYDIKIRILTDNESEIFNSTNTVSSLQPKEIREVPFTGLFTPKETGEYVFEFIKFGTLSEPLQDTIRYSFNVITTPSIAQSTVDKVSTPYLELINPPNQLFGDDSQVSLNLPFEFVFDKYTYDRLQISTNGWVEFGTGAAGSERGLSTSSQLGPVGANEEGRMASSSRPTKALGPWWEDLNADGTGVVRYQTIGIQPNRQFVIEWKDILAYWDPSTTTTRVNFQVRLYEGTNTIEYIYGDVIPGIISGPAVGASIGFKDHIGGDFHYYDIIADKTGLAGDVLTDLNPLTDWPGPDSSFVIQTILSTLQDDKHVIPNQYTLRQNYPNPFNPVTTIEFSIAESDFVNLKVYNILGEQVSSIVSKKLVAGSYKFEWRPQNMATGVYFYKLEVGDFVQVKKMLLLK